jgi:hypothetical protein
VLAVVRGGGGGVFALPAVQHFAETLALLARGLRCTLSTIRARQQLTFVHMHAHYLPAPPVRAPCVVQRGVCPRSFAARFAITSALSLPSERAGEQASTIFVWPQNLAADLI